MSPPSELKLVASVILLVGLVFVWCSTKQRSIDVPAMWIPMMFLAACTLLVNAFFE